MHHLRPKKPKKSWGRTPRPPLKQGVSFGGQTHAYITEHGITRFQTFWSKPILIPEFVLHNSGDQNGFRPKSLKNVVKTCSNAEFARGYACLLNEQETVHVLAGGGVWGLSPKIFFALGIADCALLVSSAILGRFTPKAPPIGHTLSKNFSSDLHWSQEWSWELEKVWNQTKFWSLITPVIHLGWVLSNTCTLKNSNFLKIKSYFFSKK